MKQALLTIVLCLVACVAAAQRNVDPAMARLFTQAYLGKWSSEGCGNPDASHVVSVRNDAAEMVVEFRAQNRLLATNIIALDTVRYLGVVEGLHRFGYRIESESQQGRSAFDAILETDGASRRRTYSSVRVGDGRVMIKEGKLADGSPLAFLLKCAGN